MPKIKFVNEKKEVEVPEGANLRREAQKAGVEVYPGLTKILNCQGFGMCTSCKVHIKKGMENCSKPRWWERLSLRGFFNHLCFFARIGHEDEVRLSCQTCVNGDIEVETKPPLNWHGENFFS